MQKHHEVDEVIRWYPTEFNDTDCDSMFSPSRVSGSVCKPFAGTDSVTSCAFMEVLTVSSAVSNSIFRYIFILHHYLSCDRFHAYCLWPVAFNISVFCINRIAHFVMVAVQAV